MRKRRHCRCWAEGLKCVTSRLVTRVGGAVVCAALPGPCVCGSIIRTVSGSGHRPSLPNRTPALIGTQQSNWIQTSCSEMQPFLWDLWRDVRTCLDIWRRRSPRTTALGAPLSSIGPGFAVRLARRFDPPGSTGHDPRSAAAFQPKDPSHQESEVIP